MWIQHMARTELERQYKEKEKLQEFQKQLTRPGREGWRAQHMMNGRTRIRRASVSAPRRAVAASSADVAQGTGAGRVVDATHGINRT